jgi:hypothetical protein
MVPRGNIVSEKECQVLWRCDPELKAFLDAESAASGRSVTWLMAHAVGMWKKRLERQRKNRKRARSVK